MADKTAVAVEQTAGMLIDLSTIGVQFVSQLAVKPGQEVKLTLTDASGNLKLMSKVVWASFEIPPNSGPRYRAGAELVEADAASVDAFIQRHKQPS